SGAQLSMPGMMDTVLNLGLNDDTCEGAIRTSGDPRFVWDSYRRLVQMFGSVVLGLPDEAFEDALQDLRRRRGASTDTELTGDDWRDLTLRFQAIVRDHGEVFPQDPREQLRRASEAVFDSWHGKRAVDYRTATGIPHDLGTAVNIMTMVFGNRGWDSGTGVLFTRNPMTGENELFGDYLLNAQGEDVVAGIRTPKPITDLESELPEHYVRLRDIARTLERHYGDMQDIEFTIERGELWILQTRNGKRTSQAAIRIAVDLVNEGRIPRSEALLRVRPEDVDALLHPRFDVEAQRGSDHHRLAEGVNASPGAAVGIAIFDADTAEARGRDGESVILVRPFTRPDDVHGMLAAKGLLTTEGGATSHAAVVARQFGVPCVVGARALTIDVDSRTVSVGDHVVREGEWLSLDGTTGQVYLGRIPTVVPNLDEQSELRTLLAWADEARRLEVWANADEPREASRARAFGAVGIGLCRTEHMFFGENRLPIVRRMILAESDEERDRALTELLPLQREDFEGIFRAMDGYPVIIRLLDPPLHEFLPDEREVLERVVEMRAHGQAEASAEAQHLLTRIESLHESNPMMGLRGVRLSIVRPGIVKMQVRAIFEAACRASADGLRVRPEVMIPLTSHVNELRAIKPELEAVACEVMTAFGREVDYKFGTMIEIPRAAITADRIAEVAEFFSFGTNDLTQMTFGYSRDDAEARFLLEYIRRGVLPANPFQVIDDEGVGFLIQTAVDRGRRVRPDLPIGVCGEHGGDPQSIALCHRYGLDYVSCSPFRVPVARLAAAQAALRQPG
ncbi:MAG: pyruvate, phosphate dikinase, partial [Planctomycetes bacterium]|nr:pyruvate, phosphate dikinase [Planctomycetota bacterium]